MRSLGSSLHERNSAQAECERGQRRGDLEVARRGHVCEALAAACMSGIAPRPSVNEANVEATLRSPNEATYAKPWQRKSNRLPPESYVGNTAYLLTVVTAGREAW